VAVLTEANQRIDPKLAAMAARSFRKFLHIPSFYFDTFNIILYFFSEWW